MSASQRSDAVAEAVTAVLRELEPTAAALAQRAFVAFHSLAAAMIGETGDGDALEIDPAGPTEYQRPFYDLMQAVEAVTGHFGAIAETTGTDPAWVPAAEAEVFTRTER